MKKSKAETAQTRKRIVEVAAQAFKINGIQATGVAEIMAAAGLSHGGFYRHFATKEQLVAEACAASMDILVDAAEAAAGNGDESLLKHLEDLISVEYRDEHLGGCPLVAMGSELARADLQTRRAASRGFRELIEVMAKRNREDGSASAKDDAIFTLFSMIGAITIARIMDDSEYSEQILKVARKRLTNRPGKQRATRAKSKAKGRRQTVQ
jgi:TetR/AcrR family transcriptional regulator, transcriptional repressor for nem operon